MNMMNGRLLGLSSAEKELPQRIAIVTDAWKPQMNGVVRTLETVINILRSQGHKVQVISPDQFRSLPCPTYPEIQLALAGKRRVGKMLAEFAPDAIHLSTEGPLCWAARRWCMQQGHHFTTAYHTQFPDYISRRTGLPARLFWPYVRRFHAPSARVMVSTQSIASELAAQDIGPTVHWGRGVDLCNFTADGPRPEIYAALPRPIQLYVGRVSVEKNIEAFLSSMHPGSKVVVGDGPALEGLQKQYPDAYFAGRKSRRELAGYYAGADVFVFPSKTDTFGLVNIEALACGTPVAAFPVAGPIDILTDRTGAMHDRLERAITAALWLDAEDCIAHGRSFNWESSTQQFLEGLVRLHGCPSVNTPPNIWAEAA